MMRLIVAACSSCTEYIEHNTYFFETQQQPAFSFKESIGRFVAILWCSERSSQKISQFVNQTIEDNTF